MAKLYVKRLGTDAVVKEVDIGDASPGRAERILCGLLRNMNAEEYYVDDSEVDHWSDGGAVLVDLAFLGLAVGGVLVILPREEAR